MAGSGRAQWQGSGFFPHQNQMMVVVGGGGGGGGAAMCNNPTEQDNGRAEGAGPSQEADRAKG